MYQSPLAPASFVSSPKKGIGESCNWFVVRSGAAFKFFGKQLGKMKTKQSENNFKGALRKIFGRRVRRHDPMLVLNMSVFNFTDGWSRTFSKYEYARFYA